MELNSEALHAACVEIARSTLWKPPEEVQSTENEIEALAQEYYRHALNHVEFITEQGCDPNLLVRAARYLAHTHAIPPMRDDTGWFLDMLDVLVELACPNTGLPQKGKAFITDLRRGLSTKLKME
jgi:hypothetical protein